MNKAITHARMTGIRRHWRLAKALSPSLTETDIKGWFIARGHGDTPDSPICRIRHFVKLRRNLKLQYDDLPVLKVDAAIWREICRLKKL